MDGQQFNITVLELYCDGVAEKGKSVDYWISIEKRS